MLALDEDDAVKIEMSAALLFWVSGLAAPACSEGAPRARPAPAAVAPAAGGGAAAAPAGEWALAGDAVLALARRDLRIRGPAGDSTVAGGVLGIPSLSADGARFAFARELPTELRTEVLAVELLDGAWTAPRVLAREGTPDLVSISADGRQVAFVAGARGIAAVWIAEFDGGAPVQLTNVGLRADGKGRPAGFVPIPLRDPPRFEGDRLVWTSRAGTHEVALP